MRKAPMAADNCPPGQLSFPCFPGKQGPAPLTVHNMCCTYQEDHLGSSRAWLKRQALVLHEAWTGLEF